MPLTGDVLVDVEAMNRHIESIIRRNACAVCLELQPLQVSKRHRAAGRGRRAEIRRLFYEQFFRPPVGGAREALHGVSMPMRWRLARFAAFVLWRAVPKRRHVILTNLRLCFPELSEEERVALAKRVYVRLGRAAIDHGTLWMGTREEVQALVRFKGLEHLLTPDGRPTICISPHFAGLRTLRALRSIHTYAAFRFISVRVIRFGTRRFSRGGSAFPIPF